MQTTFTFPHFWKVFPFLKLLLKVLKEKLFARLKFQGKSVIIQTTISSAGF